MKITNKPFSCAVCKNSFSILSALTEHVEICKKKLDKFKSENLIKVETRNFFKIDKNSLVFEFEHLITEYLSAIMDIDLNKNTIVKRHLEKFKIKTEFGNFQCKICSHKEMKEGLLFNHILTSHSQALVTKIPTGNVIQKMFSFVLCLSEATYYYQDRLLI